MQIEVFRVSVHNFRLPSETKLSSTFSDSDSNNPYANIQNDNSAVVGQFISDGIKIVSDGPLHSLLLCIDARTEISIDSERFPGTPIIHFIIVEFQHFE